MGLIDFFVVMASLAAIWGIMGLAYNIQYGYTGMVNLGTVAWFAIGGYTYAILTTHSPQLRDAYMFGFGFSPIIGLIGAAIVSGFVAFLIGLPSLKFKGHYFAIITFAFASILHYILINERWLTNGTIGFFGLNSLGENIFGTNIYPYFFCFITFLGLILAYLLIDRVGKSPFGRVIRGIRENDTVALSIGKNIFMFRMKVFVFSSIFIGLAGALYSMYLTLVTPGIYASTITFTVLNAVVIGGKANNKGTILGVFIIMFFAQLLRFIEVSPLFAVRMSAINCMIDGMLLVIILRYLPDGILKEKKVIYN